MKWKELAILLFVCVLSGKCFVVFYVFSLQPGVYVGTLNLVASIPGPSILTSHDAAQYRNVELWFE